MVEVKVTGANRAKKMFLELAKRVKNLKPVFEEFADFYRDDAIPRAWETRGKYMQDERWEPLTPAYTKQKHKKYGNKRLLVATGQMVDDAQNFQSVASKKNLTMTVRDVDYYWFTQHSHGRYWFYTPREDIPRRAWTYLLESTDKYLEEVDRG